MSAKEYENDALYELLPSHMREGAKMWVLYGMQSRPGSFLMAMMSNDFLQIVARADETNARNLDTWARWMYAVLPPQCYGSRAKALEWKGLYDYERTEREREPTDASNDDLRSAEQGSNS